MSGMTHSMTVKWNKNVYTIEFSPSAGVDALLQAIQDETGVPKARAKLMPKTKKMWKGVLNPAYDLTTLPPPPLVALLMGSAELPVVPKEKVQFIEDMDDEEVAKAGAVLPAGLLNLGNTCYMNSTLQCIRYATDFKEGLKSSSSPNQFNSNLSSTFSTLDGSVNAVQPTGFVMAMRSMFPQFGEMSQRGGGYAQQDAEEFLASLFMSTSQAPAPSSLQSDGVTNLSEACFGLRMEETLTCPEAGDSEKPVVKHDNAFKMICNIQGGHGQKVQISHLGAGLELGLNSEVEKNSEVLGRNAIWNKKSRVDRLPKYLCVQMMRFYWKATPDSADHQGVKCKMLREVKFGETLDMYEYCSEKLKSILKVPRDKKAKEEEEEAERKLKGTAKGDEVSEDTEMKDTDEAEDEEMKKALKLSMEAEEGTKEKAGPGLPGDFMGIYELYGVVCHKGRDSSSGHYTAWIRQEPGSDKWWSFDDEQVCEQDTKAVLDLNGGGDWHMSYLNFYRAKE